MCIKVLAIFLVCAFMAPIAFNLIHEIGHEHHVENFDNDNQTHLHELENECEFCKFKISSDVFLITGLYANLNVTCFVLKTDNQLYTNANSPSDLVYSLRGPPYIV